MSYNSYWEHNKIISYIKDIIAKNMKDIDIKNINIIFKKDINDSFKLSVYHKNQNISGFVDKIIEKEGDIYNLRSPESITYSEDIIKDYCKYRGGIDINNLLPKDYQDLKFLAEIHIDNNKQLYPFVKFVK